MASNQDTTIPEVRDAGLVLVDFQADERMRQEAWYREKQMRDEASQIDDAIEEGFEKGIEKGTLQTLVRLVNRGDLTIVQAARDAGMSETDFEALMKSQTRK